MKVREIIKLIEKDGWRLDRQKGSHKIFIHHSKSGHVTVADHGKNEDMKKGTVSHILKQAGLK